MSSTAKVGVLIRNNSKRRSQASLFRRMVRQTLRNLQIHKDTEVSILLVDDEEIQELNRRFRNIDSPTDVLSFPMQEGESATPSLPGVPHLLGDIVISLETAERQAKEGGISLEEETALLAVHGTLHLLGYDDSTEEPARLMHEKEMEILDLAGFGPEPACTSSRPGEKKKIAPKARGNR